MSKRIDFTKPGGYRLDQSTFEFMQSGYNDAIRGLANMAGNMVIVSGMVETSANVSAGWIVIGGELIPFQPGPKQSTFVIVETSSALRFKDGLYKTVVFSKLARFGSGVGQYQYADLKRISSNSFMLDSETFATSRALKRLAELALYENTVIISGCEVSNVNTVASTCTIAPGKVLLGDAYYETPAYNGTFPVWINASGAFVGAAPDGLSIDFDPFPSQRKADVLRRAVTPVGQVIELTTWTDRFDLITGVGRWEMKGFQISEDDRGRVSMGFDPRTVDPANGIWDANYNTPGHFGGSKSQTLTMQNLPEIIPLEVPTFRENGFGAIASGGGINDGDFIVNLENEGGGQPVDVRMPYVVRLKVIRIED